MTTRPRAMQMTKVQVFTREIMHLARRNVAFQAFMASMAVIAVAVLVTHFIPPLDFRAP